MSQPVWKFVANLGDSDFVEHGGLFVYEDETGVYDPEMELLEMEDEFAKRPRWMVRRVVLDRCKVSRTPEGVEVLSNNPFHPLVPAWFEDDLPSIASHMGVKLDDLRAGLCSIDPTRRAASYRAIGDYAGWDNLDDDPQILNKRQVHARYKDLLRP